MKLVLAVLLVSTVAHAESKAWSVGKKVIPANMEVVGGVNAATAHSSALYQNLLPMALGKAGGAVTTQLDGIKADCGIDMIDSLDSIAFALDSTEKSGTFVIAFRGTTRAKLEACLQKRAKAQQKTVTITNTGGLTKYSGMGDQDAYARWLGPDVVALSTTPEDKDATLHATAGGLGGEHAMHGLGTVNTNASVWLVSTKQGDMPGDFGGKMTGAYGSANLGGGAINVDMHVVTDSPKTATDSATKASAELEAGRQNGSGGGGMFADLLKTVKIAAAGSEIAVTAQVPEKSVLDLLSMFGVH